MGWLDRDAPYESGAVSPEFVSALFTLCHNKVNKMRGFHRCNLCSSDKGGPHVPLVVSMFDSNLTVGNAEIRVTGSERTFAAPDMIIHYVAVHGYRPPQEFIDAVTSGGDQVV